VSSYVICLDGFVLGCDRRYDVVDVYFFNSSSNFDGLVYAAAICGVSGRHALISILAATIALILN
jgi:hypothetical protein